jgi:ankyrin repeat protein
MVKHHSQIAVDGGHVTIVEPLLARDDVEINIKDRFGRKPISTAVANRHESIVKLLLARRDVTIMGRRSSF